MRFSHLQKQPTNMYLYNSYNQAPKAPSLTMEAFVAPADFNPDAQELNIVTAFAAYPDANKKYIFSVGTSTTTVLPAVTGRSYAYAENGGAYTTIASGTITWTVGSTKRNVVVIDISDSYNVNIIDSVVWIYFGNGLVNNLQNSSNSLKYIHASVLSNIRSISGGAFWACTSLIGIITIPQLLKSINEYAFYGCSGLTGNLIIPPSVTTIGSNAFSGCSGLTGNLTISASVNTISISPFIGCNFSEVSVDASNTYYTSEDNVVYNYSKTQAIYCAQKSTGIINLPNGIISILDGAFRSCIRTGSLLIPTTVINIGSNAFSGCSGLTGNLIIPPSVTTIGSNAFNGCSGLTGNLTISESVATIGSNAFQSCSRISGLNIYSVNTGYWAFSYMPSLTTVILNEGVTTIDGGFLAFCPNITSPCTIPASVISIDPEYFMNLCSGINALNLPVNYSLNFLTFIFSSNFSASSLNQSIINITSGTKTLAIGETNKARLLAAYPTAEANANARGITIN